MTVERKAYSIADNEIKNRRLGVESVISREDIEKHVKIFGEILDEALRNNEQVRFDSRLDSRGKRI